MGGGRSGSRADTASRTERARAHVEGAQAARASVANVLARFWHRSIDMIFTELPLGGARLVAPEPIADDRGHFARLFCAETFRAHGLSGDLVQASESASARIGTTRGLHFQHPPYAEDKLVRCTRGRVFDVIVDLRADSPTRFRWHGTELSAANGLQFYVPKGFAHGFQVLEAGSVMHYLVSAAYVPGAEGGVRWDDPVLGIDWPLGDGLTLSGRDLALPAVVDLGPVF